MIKMAVIKKNVPIKDSVTESIEFIENEANNRRKKEKEMKILCQKQQQHYAKVFLMTIQLKWEKYQDKIKGE